MFGQWAEEIGRPKRLNEPGLFKPEALAGVLPGSSSSCSYSAEAPRRSILANFALTAFAEVRRLPHTGSLSLSRRL